MLIAESANHTTIILRKIFPPRVTPPAILIESAEESAIVPITKDVTIFAAAIIA